MAEEKIYEVIVTNPAMFRFQDEILEYIERNFSISRASQVEAGLLKMVSSLGVNPQRGAFEKTVMRRGNTFRFILYRETIYFELKILFFIDESAFKVYVTDFFPTRMNPTKMKFK